MSLGSEEAARARAQQNGKTTRIEGKKAASERNVWADLLESLPRKSQAEELMSQGKHLEAVAEMTPAERKKYGVINLYGGA